MNYKIKTYILTFSAALLFSVPVMVLAGGASAASAPVKCSHVANKISDAANDVSGGGGKECKDPSGTGDSAITKAARGLITTFSIIVSA